MDIGVGIVVNVVGGVVVVSAVGVVFFVGGWLFY